MRTQRTRAKRRILRRTAGIAAGGLAVLLVALWLTFQHKPGWYHPAPINESTLRRARRESAEVVDATSRRLVEGQAFEVTLSQRQVNDWLAAWPELAPHSAGHIPSSLRDIAVAFDEGLLRVGAYYEHDGWRTVVNLALRLEVTPDGQAIHIRLVEANGGSLPIPDRVLGNAFRSWLKKVRRRRRDDADEASKPWIAALRGIRSWEDLRKKGIAFRNDFLWPNGKRPGKITAIVVGKGTLRLRIQPL